MEETLKLFQSEYKKHFNEFISMRKINIFLFSFSPKLEYLKQFLTFTEVNNLLELYNEFDFQQKEKQINDELENEADNGNIDWTKDE